MRVDSENEKMERKRKEEENKKKSAEIEKQAEILMPEAKKWIADFLGKKGGFWSSGNLGKGFSEEEIISELDRMLSIKSNPIKRRAVDKAIYYFLNNEPNTEKIRREYVHHYGESSSVYLYKEY